MKIDNLNGGEADALINVNTLKPLKLERITEQTPLIPKNFYLKGERNKKWNMIGLLKKIPE